MDGTDPTAWLRLARLRGGRYVSVRRLLERFGSAAALFEAGREALRTALGDDRATLAAILAPPGAGIERDLAWLAAPDHHLLGLTESPYPALLREIADPPLVLFAAGDPAVLQRPQVAVVGSRNPGPSGRQTAYRFAAELAGQGLVVTSGLAVGIDAEAHRGALDAACPTVAVAGTGLDTVYPRANRGLANRIIAEGVVVSEFPIGVAARAGHFPRRNRIISGLARAVLVVEAAERSGSLITARLAGEQGRDVFAVPGSIYSPNARGCHALIRQGALLVDDVRQIFAELGLDVAAAGWSAVAVPQLEPAAARIYAAIEHVPASVDAVIQRSGLTADRVSSILLQLELMGLVVPCLGGAYVRAVPPKVD